MMKLPMILLSCLAHCHISYCDENINNFFDKINNNFIKFNSLAAKITWESSVKPGNSELEESTSNYQKKWVVWQQRTCERLAELEKRQLLNETQRRQTYLLCRGPKYTYPEARALTSLYDELQSLYSNNKICIPVQRNVSKDSLREIEEAIFNYLSTVNQLLKVQNGATFASKMAAKSSLNEGLCLNGEEDFERLMKNVKNEEVLRWLWLAWREKIGEPMKEPYRQLVDLENRAAWRKGYPDIGASWRDELEVPNLRQKCRQLYSDVRPLYTLLHGVVRFFLRKHYGDVVPRNGPIPAHLLGNLWSQNWETMADFITTKTINLDHTIGQLNWTVHHMVKRVEDFYQSLGLPAMTNTFWRESVFENKNGGVHCHGTAADMFQDGDFRLLYCSGKTMEDFYVLHHEFGHIHYYMAYENQPGLFRQANAALHESIGDAIMYGVMTPQHLHRLGLVNDSVLYVNSSGNFNIRSAPDTKDYQNLDEEKPGDVSEKTNDELVLDKRSRQKTKHENVVETNVKTDDRRQKTNDDIFKKRLDQKTKHYRNIRYGRTNENFIGKTKDDTFANQLIETKYYNTDILSDGENEELKTDDFELVDDLTSDEVLLLKQALNKIPQIPFALVVDEYRWRYFEDAIDKGRLNKEFWDLSLELQGIAPPVERGEEYFDIAAKYHVPDNTPYIRYFLSNFIQHQIFEALCRTAVFGRRDTSSHIPDSISLNRCDIYGSKAAGKLLRDFMSRGHSQHWQEILMSTTGNTDISAAALERYYRPLYKVLQRIVRRHKIPLGW